MDRVMVRLGEINGDEAQVAKYIKEAKVLFSLIILDSHIIFTFILFMR